MEVPGTRDVNPGPHTSRHALYHWATVRYFSFAEILNLSRERSGISSSAHYQTAVYKVPPLFAKWSPQAEQKVQRQGTSLSCWVVLEGRVNMFHNVCSSSRRFTVRLETLRNLSSFLGPNSSGNIAGCLSTWFFQIFNFFFRPKHLVTWSQNIFSMASKILVQLVPVMKYLPHSPVSADIIFKAFRKIGSSDN